MEEKQDILTCVCPLCNKPMRIKRPQKEGKYKFVRVHCKQPFALTYKEEQPQENKGGAPEQPSQQQKQLDPQQQQQQSQQQQPKQQQPPVSKPVDPRYMTIGGLVECKKGFFSKDKIHALHEGVQTIGRNDPGCTSDIMIDDPTISRRSLKLVVEKKQSAGISYYSYTMAVENAKNPVIYNGDKLTVGDVVELQIDDTIKIGKTKLILR